LPWSSQSARLLPKIEIMLPGASFCSRLAEFTTPVLLKTGFPVPEPLMPLETCTWSPTARVWPPASWNTTLPKIRSSGRTITVAEQAAPLLHDVIFSVDCGLELDPYCSIACATPGTVGVTLMLTGTARVQRAGSGSNSGDAGTFTM